VNESSEKEAADTAADDKHKDQWPMSKRDIVAADGPRHTDEIEKAPRKGSRETECNWEWFGMVRNKPK